MIRVIFFATGYGDSNSTHESCFILILIKHIQQWKTLACAVISQHVERSIDRNTLWLISIKVWNWAQTVMVDIHDWFHWGVLCAVFHWMFKPRFGYGQYSISGCYSCFQLILLLKSIQGLYWIKILVYCIVVSHISRLPFHPEIRPSLSRSRTQS